MGVPLTFIVVVNLSPPLLQGLRILAAEDPASIRRAVCADPNPVTRRLPWCLPGPLVVALPFIVICIAAILSILIFTEPLELRHCGLCITRHFKMPFLVTLHLKLNQPSGHVYRPGDLVSGTVWLRSDVDEDVKTLSIVLKDRTTIRFIVGPRKFREDYNLFVILGFLFQGPQKLKKFEVHEWPFEFVFPELSELDFEGAQMAEGGARFQLSPHQLPPSLPFDQANCGGVIYEVEAILQNTGKGEKVQSRAENLTFRPRDGGLVDSDHVEHREFKFISRRIPPRSAGQKVRSFFVWDESNRPLTTSFTIQVDVPHDLFLDQLIPVSILLRRKEESTMEAIPSFFLHTAKIYLITTTAARFLNLAKVPPGHRFRETRKSRFLDGGYDMTHELKT